jgi:hypothetical protein
MPMPGTRTIAESNHSVMTRLDGRRRTPTFPQARETCPMPGTSHRDKETFAPQTADSDGDFVQGILTQDQYEIIET